MSVMLKTHELKSVANRVGVFSRALLVVGALVSAINVTYVSAKENEVSNAVHTFEPIVLTVPDMDNAPTAETYTGTLNQIRASWATTISGDVVRGRVSQTIPSPLSGMASYARLKFKVDNDFVEFYIKPENFYVVGYVVANRYFALKDDPVPSEFKGKEVKLTFKGDYQSLGDGNGAKRKTIKYGWVELQSVLDPLIKKPGNEAVSKKALITVIPMFMEGARFKPSIGNRIHANIVRSGAGAPLENADLQLMDNWSKLSKFGFSILDKPTTPPLTVNGKTYKTFDDVAGDVAAFLITQKNRADSLVTTSSQPEVVE